MPHEEVKEKNIEHVLEMAYHLFLSNGIERTTKEMIVRASGISRSSIDRYFETKLELVLRTAEWVGENVRDKNLQVQTRFQDETRSGLGMLKTYLEIIMELMYTNPRLFALSAEYRAFVFRDCFESLSGPSILSDSLGSSALLERIFERGREDGSFMSGLDAKVEAAITRESTLGFFSSIALTNSQDLVKYRLMTELFISRIIRQYERKEEDHKFFSAFMTDGSSQT